MKTNEVLNALILEFGELGTQLQIVEYELANKPHFPREFHVLKEIERKSLEFEMGLLKEAIDKENKDLGNSPIKNIYEVYNEMIRNNQQ